MFNLSILLVFGVIMNANGHLLKQLLHNMHEKYHSTHGHHSTMFMHSGPRHHPQFGAQSQFEPQYPPFGPPPFGFPPHHTPHHHNCQNQPCHYPYPNNGQLPYPLFNPHLAPNYQPTAINTPNTININNINANSQQDATSISSAPTDVNVNVIPNVSNVPNYPTGINGLGSDVLTNSQSVHGGNQADINYGQTQPLNPSIVASNGDSTNGNINNNNNNAYLSSTSQNNPNEFGSMFGNNLNNLATVNGLANGLNAQTTSLNAQTTNLNAQTTNLNAQTTNFNGNSNNAMFNMANQFGVDLNTFNAMSNLFNGAAVQMPLSSDVNNLNNYNNNNNNIPQTVTQPQTVPTHTELPTVSSTTNRDGMEYDIDIRFGDNNTKTESKN